MTRKTIPLIYEILYDAFGPQGWWPGESREEIIVGAVLTQNTNWKNVERAIANLKASRALSLEKISKMPLDKTAALIRPSGYYNIKSQRLKSVADFFMQNFPGDLNKTGDIATDELRSSLLNVHGVGPETADSILLYALERPVFVVDAYTMRIGKRHAIISEKDDYELVRAMFENSLERNVPLFNEYHALLVKVGKDLCRPRKAICEKCPLRRLLP